MMQTLTIYPTIGVNKLQLGMTPDEVEAILGKANRKESYRKEEYSFEYDRTAKGSLLFFLTFRNDKLAEIEIMLDTVRGSGEVIVGKIDLCTVHAEDVVSILSAESCCLYDVCTGRDLSYEYLFPDLGLYFYRSSAFHPKLLKTDYYADWDPEVVEDEKKYWFLETVTVMSCEDARKNADEQIKQSSMTSV